MVAARLGDLHHGYDRAARPATPVWFDLWIRGARHVEFSTTIRKIKSRISFEPPFLPITRRALENARQYSANPICAIELVFLDSR